MRPRAWYACGWLLAWMLAPPGAWAQQAAAEGAPEGATKADGPSYSVSAVQLSYNLDSPKLPPLAELRELPITLGLTLTGFVAPREGVEEVVIRLGSIPGDPPPRFHASAIRAMDEQIVAELNRRGLAGVIVAPEESSLQPGSGADLRGGETTLPVVVTVPHVKEVRTFASGDRVDPEQAVDNPVHAKIKDDSPLKAGTDEDVLRKDQLDRYVARLNRYPGRRVEPAISPALEQGGVYLDYQVLENKPWTAYFQASNTGTPETSEWRQRFGYVNTQATNNDDTFAIDYITGDFSTVHALTGSYDAPLFSTEDWRWTLFGSYSKFDSSVVGFDLDFTGKQWEGGLRLSYTFFQFRDLFFDVFAGTRIERVWIDNPDGNNGSSNFFLPQVGVRASRMNDFMNLFGSVSFEHNLGTVVGTDVRELEDGQLARTNASAYWSVLRWELALATYLEPLFAGGAWSEAGGFWNEKAPPGQVLANEIYLSARGQWAFNDRLVPWEERVIGGLYTVRGYPEASSVGDSVFLGSFEYRWHIPRLFPSRPPTKLPGLGEFRFAPESKGDRPDWDLVLRTFVDVGYAIPSKYETGEFYETLVGCGVGLELLVKRNFSVRFDWGVALKDAIQQNASDNTVKAGNNEYRVVFTVLY